MFNRFSKCTRWKSSTSRGLHLASWTVLNGASSSSAATNVDHGEFVAQIRQCRDVVQAKQIHAEIVRRGLTNDRLLANFMVEMYGRCGYLAEAKAAFDTIIFPNVFSFTMLITAYAQSGDSMAALQAFRRMDLDGLGPDSVIFVGMIDMFTSRSMLFEGRLLHDRINRSGFGSHVIVATAVLNMYAKSGNLDEAEAVFESMACRDVIAWNSMIVAYAKNGRELEALRLFQRMELEGIKPDRVVFLSLLDVCTKLEDLGQGRVAHARLSSSGFSADGPLGNALVNMYGKCGSLDEAKMVFDGMDIRTEVSWNSMMSVVSQQGQSTQALKLFFFMALDGIKPDKTTFLSIVEACTTGLDCEKALKQGKQIHGLWMEIGFQMDSVLGNALLNLYGKCGRLEDARAVFNSMEHCRDLISWTVMLSTYTQLGHPLEAFQTYREAELEGFRPDYVTLIAVLEACSSTGAVHRVREVQARAEWTGSEQHVVLGTALVDAFGKCGCLAEARAAFVAIGGNRNQVSWNAMMRAYTQNGCPDLAFGRFQEMQAEGIKPDVNSFVAMVDVAGSLEQGDRIHQMIAEVGLERNLAHSLVTMYGKHGDIEAAESAFYSLDEKETPVWNSLMSAYIQNGYNDEATRLLHQMDLEGEHPNTYSFLGLLESASGDLHQVKLIKDRLGLGANTDTVVGNVLIKAYGACKEVQLAECIFHDMQARDIISWTTMLAVYASNGRARGALELFHKMHLEGVQPDRITFLSLVDACSMVLGIDGCPEQQQQAKQVARHILTMVGRFESDDVVLQTTLLNMYGKYGDYGQAKRIFDGIQAKDVVTWNAMLSAYVQNGVFKEAMGLFRTMELEGMKADRITFINVLDAVGATGDKVVAVRLQSRLVDVGATAALENSLLSMYSRLGCPGEAKAVFEGIHVCRKDAQAWAAMVSAYAHAGQPIEAIALLKSMDHEGIMPNRMAFLKLVDAVATLGDAEQGTRLQQRICDQNHDDDSELGNALVAMLGKCGQLQQAREIFDKMPQKGIQAWTSMVTAYARNGHPLSALGLLSIMELEGVPPNGVTVLAVMAACSHAGLLPRGLSYLASMAVGDQGTTKRDHYNCIVDLLGRVGWLQEARDLAAAMPAQADLATWKTLLLASTMHGDIAVAEEAASMANSLQPVDASPYVMLSNAYASRS